jgi:excisionase family DNA binding protein
MAEDADFSTWPTKHEARLQLGGVPERTFDRWLADHNVKVAYRNVTGRRPVPVVDPAGIATIEREMMQVAHRPAPVPATQEKAGPPAHALDIPPAWREMAATLLVNLSALAVQAQAPPLPALFFTLEEASTYSGLPRDLLTRLIRARKLPAWSSGGYRISRKDLDALVEMTPLVELPPTGQRSRGRKAYHQRA